MDETFLFFHSWTWDLKYIIHFTKINSVINYFHLRSLSLQKHFSCFSISEVKIIYNEIYLSKIFINFKSHVHEWQIQKVSLSFFKAFFIHQKISQIVVKKCILFVTPFKLFVDKKSEIGGKFHQFNFFVKPCPTYTHGFHFVCSLS